MNPRRPIFVVRLRAERGVDAIRALRALLKVALRRFGLRAVSLDAEAAAAMSFAIGPLARVPIVSRKSAATTGEEKMQMGKYVKKYLKLDDVREGPLFRHIAEVKEGSFDKPELVFETGEILSLNVTSTLALVTAYGGASEGWVGKKVEIYLGQAKFKNGVTDAVLVKPVTPGLSDEAKAEAAVKSAAVKDKANRGGDMSDDIPF
jgi:hypothetical protein